MSVPPKIPSVLFVLRSLHTGGAERQVVELAKGLVARGGRAAVAVFYADGHLAEELAAAGVKLFTLGKRGRWDLLGPIARLRELVRAEGFEVLHGYMPSANVLTAVASLGLPVRLVWGVRASDVDWSAYDRTTRMVFDVSCWLSGRPSLIISNSVAGVRFHVSQGYPESRFRVVPNGIDATRFRPDPARRSAWRRAQGIEEGRTVIAIVARLDPMKDHATFLRAVAAGRDLTGPLFVIAGSGAPEVRAELERLAVQLGISDRIRWLGDVHDIGELLAGVDLVTSTSRFGEGFSNAIAEAMAAGVPCVVTDCGDARLLVGETGVVVPIGDAAGIAAGWRELLSGGRAARGKAARARIETEYSLARLADRTIAALGAA